MFEPIPGFEIVKGVTENRRAHLFLVLLHLGYGLIILSLSQLLFASRGSQALEFSCYIIV